MNASLQHLSRSAWLATLLASMSLAGAAWGAQPVGLRVEPQAVRLAVGGQVWRFTRAGGTWALDAVEVRGVDVAQPLSREDSFFVGAGTAQGVSVLTNRADLKAVAFQVGSNRVVYAVAAADRLPLVHVRIEGPATATFALRSVRADAHEHGAWVTRGYVATDTDEHEDFIDGSNPLVFGHSQTGDEDTCYLFLPIVHEHIQNNGRTEQRSDTWFQSARREAGGGRFYGYWHLRLGRKEPKDLAVLLDRDLGGRISDVCEKYYADAVDTLVDVATIPFNFDPDQCLQILPVRLAAPDAFIPGWGWMMDEFPNASYPFAHDAVWQQPALLAFEGLATGRAWERNFARYLLDKTPLAGPDGKSYFVRRPGGLTRWGYFATYRDGFPPLDGGTWWTADVLYRTALALDDPDLRRAAVDMVCHDLDVKLDLDHMSYPPCWSAAQNRVGDDHRDDWFKTPGLAYCAYVASKIAYAEKKDPAYLAKADRLCDWFAGYLADESKLNFLQGNNMYATFSFYLALAFLDRFDRSHDRRFLDMARDMAWVQIMTLCTTPAKDTWGNPLTGVTCVGVRGCADYDCSPNLCQEKDLNFVHLIGPLLDHVSGPAYGKYLELQRLVLNKDAWKSAWVAELRDTNLRTMYDTYARGMANLVYALNQSSDPRVVAVEKLASEADPAISHRRAILLANGTRQDRTTTLKIRFLQPGTYAALLNGQRVGHKTHQELASGLPITMPANATKEVQVLPVSRAQPTPSPRTYDPSRTYLSELEPFAAQRGTGFPQPTYRNDQSFDGHTITLKSGVFPQGLGCAANTVLVYRLDGQYERFKASVGVDQEVAGTHAPPPSVFFTLFVDGILRFESGPMFQDTPAREVDVEVRNAQMLMLRMSCNWDDNGNSINDHGDWASARLEGKARP